MSTAEFREKCKEFALEQIELQKKDFRRLGVRGDFNHRYITLKPEYEAAQIRIFGEMADKGLIYKSKEPVN
ncbi:class I tRNA ligase family protein [Staphylococcus aureus]